MSFPIVTWIKWDLLDSLVCPCLRYLKIFSIDYERGGVWVAQKEFPCILKKCGKRGCHNYGLKTHFATLVILKGDIDG